MSTRHIIMLVKIMAGLAALGVTAVLVGAVFLAGYVLRVTEDLPEIDELAQYEPPVMTRVHAGDGRLIAEYARESRVFVPIENIPEPIVHAFISAEDKNFFTHNGFDPMGFIRGGLRSAFNVIRGSGGLQSGSTITQQVAKNFLLTSDQNLQRKIREIFIALRIEQAFSKDEILELYLNEIYLGRRSYGVAAASLLYFGKSLDELSLSEMAYLAALPKAPSRLDITRQRNKAYAVSRRNYVLGRMVANGYVSQADHDAAAKEDLNVAERLSGSTYRAAEYFVEEVRREIFSMYGEDELYDGGLSVRTTVDTELQLAAREALRAGLEAYDRRHGYRGPLATLDPNGDWAAALAELETPTDIGGWAPAVVLELREDAAVIGLLDGSRGRIPFAPPETDDKGKRVADAERPIEDTPLAWARRIDANGRVGPLIETPGEAVALGDVILVEPLEADADADGPSLRGGDGLYALRQIPEVNGAIMAMDPHTGRVLAMVGGYSFSLSQFNRATQARRQPGSAFKPFVYAAALDVRDERGDYAFTPAYQELDSAYVSTGGRDGTFYKPSNYEGRWYGLQTLRVGIERSRNTMTVRLANKIGLNRVSSYGERFGIYDNLPPYEAMALGAGETTLWRMVAAYAMLVNGGKRIEPTILDRVQDRDGRTIFRRGVRTCTDVCQAEAWADMTPPLLADPRADVIDPITAYQVVSMMEGVVTRGTARRVGQALDKPVAGKTGTTNDFRDAWFVGFAPDLVVGVFVGFDSPKPLGTVPEGEGGGKVAAPVFQAFMERALPRYDTIPFRIPSGVVFANIDANSGRLARPGATTPYFAGPSGSCKVEPVLEAFHPGTQPTQMACTGETATDSGVSVGAARRPTPSGELSALARARRALGLPVPVEDEPILEETEDDEDDGVGGLF